MLFVTRVQDLDTEQALIMVNFFHHFCIENSYFWFGEVYFSRYTWDGMVGPRNPREIRAVKRKRLFLSTKAAESQTDQGGVTLVTLETQLSTPAFFSRNTQASHPDTLFS